MTTTRLTGNPIDARRLIYIQIRWLLSTAISLLLQTIRVDIFYSMHTHASEYIRKIKSLFLHPTVQSVGLNAVRVLSLVSLILVFASTVIDMDTNVRAVNAFDMDDDSSLADCEYIELSGFFLLLSFLLLTDFLCRGSSVPNQPAGIFWAYMASLFIIFQTIILSRQFLTFNSNSHV